MYFLFLYMYIEFNIKQINCEIENLSIYSNKEKITPSYWDKSQEQTMQPELQISKGSRNNSDIRDPLSELSQEDDSNEGSQHMFYRNIRKIIP